MAEVSMPAKIFSLIFLHEFYLFNYWMLKNYSIKRDCVKINDANDSILVKLLNHIIALVMENYTESRN